MLKTQTIQEELNLISTTVANLPNTHPFDVPHDYFHQLSARILHNAGISGSAVDADPDLSPLLASLKELNPYSVPVDYFRELKVTPQKPDTKIVRIQPWKTWTAYAAAACLAGIMVIGGVFNNGTGKAPETMALKENTLAEQAVSTETIQSYLNEADAGQATETMNNETGSENNLLVELNTEIIATILKEIPENDISFYMAQTGDHEMLLLN